MASDIDTDGTASRSRARSWRRGDGPDVAFGGRAAARLAPRLLGVVPEGAVRRRPSDIARLVLAALVVALTAASAGGSVSSITAATAQLLDELPAPLGDLGEALTGAALAFVVVVVAVVALWFRRRRLARSTVAGGLLALLVGWWLDGVVGAEAARAADAAFAGWSRIPVYPPLGLCVLVALVETASPFLTRPARRLARTIVVVSVIADLLARTGLPVDVIGAVAVGVGVSALIHLAFGSPAGTPTAADVADDLAALGVRASDVTLVPTPDWGTSTFSAVDPHGARLDVAVHGRDDMDARVIAKLWRAVWYRSSGPRFEMSRLQQVEHEAYATLLAGSFGASVGEVVVAGRVEENGDALFVSRRPPGEPLASVDPALVSDEVLASTWAAAGRVWAAGIAHGSLHTGHVLVDDAGTGPSGGDRGRPVAIVAFGQASTAALEAQILSDQVELLATTAVLVGIDRALAAAAGELGLEGIARLEPRMQRAALSSGGQDLVTDKALFPALRSATAAYAGTPPTELEKLVRVSWGQVGMAAATLFGLSLLVDQLTSVDGLWSVIQTAEWEWVLATFVVAQLPNLSDGVALTGAVQGTLRLGPTTMLEVANKFTGLVAGTVGTTATRIRFFQKQGLGVNAAVTGGALSSAAGFAAQIVLIVLSLFIAGDQFQFPSLSSSGSGGNDTEAVVLAIVVVVLVLVAVGLGVPRLRRWVKDNVVPQLREAGGSLRAVLSSPGKAARLFGGQFVTQVLFAVTLGLACRAYGQDVDLAALILINSFASFIGGIAPVPGGLGAVEAGMIGGLTAVGVPQDEAVAATLTARLMTAYLPPIWGWLSLRWLRAHDEL